MKLGKILLLLSMLNTGFLQAFHLDCADTQLKTKKPRHFVPLDVSKFFAKKKFYLNDEQVVTEPLALQQAAKDSLRYIKRYEATHIHLVDPIGFASILPLQDVKNTLQFIVKIIEEDKKSGVFRLLDPVFINKHFSSIAWNADQKSANKNNIILPDNNHIRLTTYAVFNVQGSKNKTETHPCALYSLQDYRLARRFTKQQILSGALEREPYASQCVALAWVSHQALEDALMNGTILVTFPDDSSRLLNVHNNNGIKYDKTIKDRTEQKRYWFFKDIGTKVHEAANRVERIKKRKDVIFAGDLKNIGLGKLIALRHKNPQTQQAELRLGILADTGSAFNNNLYQLDYFGGLTQNDEELKQIVRSRPTFTNACVLYKKG